MRGLRALAWLACVAAAEPASGATTAREIAARNAAAEMIKSRLATQTTRPAFEQGRRRLECVNDDSTTDRHGGTCSDYYDSRPGSCGNWDYGDFTASEQCCACGGGEGTFAPTLGPTFTPTANPTLTFTPTATVAPTVSSLVADNVSIREAVALWLSNRAVAIRTYGHISKWGTTGVTDMSELFCADDINCDFYNEAASSFDDNITAWDISGVTNMRYIFSGASAFDQAIGNWQVDQVTDMNSMFSGASSFNQPIGDWRVDEVTDMSGMFSGASSFDQPIGDWRVDKVTDMSGMFSGASAFNQDIGGWAVHSVTSMFAMFRDAWVFNQPIGGWRVEKVTSMRFMFANALSFNQPLSNWRIDNVEDMEWMFRYVSAFDQALGWCVRESDNIDRAFDGTKCEAISCGVVQGTCPDPEATAGDYCKLSDPELCSGNRYSFVEAQSNPFANIIENRFAVPTLGDIDDDGHDALLVGQEDGTVALYRQAGSEFQLAVGDEDPFKSITVNGNAAPALVDLDSDGNLDLIVGVVDGRLVYFRNEGSMTFRRVTATEAPTFDPTPVPTSVQATRSLRLVGGSTEYEGRVEILHDGDWGTVCDDEWDILDANVVCQQLFGTAAVEAKKEAFFRGGIGQIWMGSVRCIGAEAALWQCPFDGWGKSDCNHALDAGVICEAAPTQPDDGVARRLLDQHAEVDPFASIHVDAHSAPAFADLDSDGLVDLVIGKESAGALTYYKNVGSSTTAEYQVEEDGPFENVRVGRFSKPTFYDIDNDGDQDLIVGDRSGDVRLFLNVGSLFDPSFSAVEDALAGRISAYAAPTFGVLNGIPSLVVGSAPGLVVYGETPNAKFITTRLSPFDGIDVGHNSDPIFVDLDGDGLMDLVVGGSEALSYYRNVGTPSEPAFEKVEEESPFDGIDARSAPTFVDLDNDGDMDLVVGNGNGWLSYYSNVGSPSQPSFEKVGCVDDLRTKNSIGADCSGYYWVSAADLPDICKDFDDEDFTATKQCCACGGGTALSRGTIKWEDPFDGIGSSIYERKSKPIFTDLDGDGLVDLVVGGQEGYLRYWRNVGTPSQPIFEQVGGCVDYPMTTDSEGNDCSYYDRRPDLCDGRFDDDDFTSSDQCCICGGGLTKEGSPLDGIDVNGDEDYGYSAPTFVDLDNDGDLDLIVGSGGETDWDNDGGGKIFYWRNVGTSSQPNFEQVVEKSPFDGIDVGDYSSPTFADLDNDGDPDLVVGREDGRLSYFQNAGSCRKTGVDGVCSGNGICGAYQGGMASCQCVVPWGGSQCGDCAEGTYKDDDGVCQSCKNGMVCDEPGQTLENVRLEKNRWRTSPKSTRIETCPLDSACRSTEETQERRRLDESQDDDYDAGENLCASGYHGPLCAVCRNHHYRSGNECKKCSRGSEALNIILACAVFVGFVVAAALSIIYSKNFLKKSMDYFKKGEKGADGLADNAKATEAIWRTMKTAIKQMLGMWSVVSNTPWILDVTYPKIFDKVLAFLSNVFSFDFTIAADCAVNRMGFKDTLLLNTLVPFVLCALIALLALVVAKWPRKKMAREHDGVQKQSVQYAFNIILFIVFLSYTTASTTVFRALRPCHKFDEDYHGSNKYMKDDYGTSCRSNRHDFIRAYAWIMLFIYPIGVPLLTFVFLWRHRETLNPDVRVTLENRDLGGRADGAQKKSVGSCTDISLRRSCHALLGRSSDAHGHFDDVQREIVDAKIARRGELIKNMQKGRGFLERPELFAFMYDNYEPEYWWFECFDYIRRLLLTGILVVFEPGSATQGLFGVLVALFGTQVYSWTRPFPENAGDRLAESAQWSTFFTFLAALMILVNVDAANSTDQTIFGVLLIVIQFMPVAIGVGVGALNKNLKVKGKAQGLDKEAKGLGDKISSEEPESEHRSSDATTGVTGRDEADEEQPATNDTN